MGVGMVADRSVSIWGLFLFASVVLLLHLTNATFPDSEI
jgi:hypothetical protein